MKYEGTIHAEVTGICASIASVIMLAAEHISVSPTATIMIHNVWSQSQGDYREMSHQSDILKEMSASFAKMYAKRMDITEEEAQAAMDEETYFSADQALNAGLVDEKLFDESQEKAPLQMVASLSPMISSEKIARLKQAMVEEQNPQPTNTIKLDEEVSNYISAIMDEKIATVKAEIKQNNNVAEKPVKNHKFISIFGGI
jgi:ATP-dependent Clp protease protease subunit